MDVSQIIVLALLALLLSKEIIRPIRTSIFRRSKDEPPDWVVVIIIIIIIIIVIVTEPFW